jgi:HemY protein
LMNYLGAAKAAQEQGAFERRDNYIQKAYRIAPSEELAIGLTKAELELDQHQYEHAAATLNHLRQTNANHPRVAKLLEKVYVHLGDWQNLLKLLPELRKGKILNAGQMEQFEKNLYGEILHTANDKNLDEIHGIWYDMPRSVRKNPDVVSAYVKQLSRFPDTAKEMEDLIRKTLKTHWQPDLVKIYGTLPFANLNRQLVIAGAWLKMYGQHPELLLLLGKLCMRIQLWGKAKDYFEKCLALSPNPEASLEYGKLLEDLGESDNAIQKYRDGLVSSITK